jgi:hypothetical protein
MIYTFHDAIRLTNERVPKNKSYSFTAGYASSGLGSSLADYDYSTYGGYKVDAPKMPQAHGNFVDEDSLSENFSTWKDERDAQKQVDYCDMCGTKGELSEGYCLECLMWMKDMEAKDVPPTYALGVR